ncbi:MAG: phosphoglycolate phosphatase [Granulosicoccus sp.]
MKKDTSSCNFDLVAIDLDGTLVDSVGDLHAAVVDMLVAIDRPPVEEEDVRSWVGNGVERLVHRALTRHMDRDADEVEFKTGLACFQQAYERVNGRQSRLYPGVAEGLEWLATLGIPLVMITNKASQFAYPLLASMNIAEFFQHGIAGDEVAAKKPDPAALLLAAERFEANPERCLLIGDSVSDIKAARAARFTSICVSYGYNHGQSVRALQGQLKPDAIIDSFTELPTAFTQLSM